MIKKMKNLTLSSKITLLYTLLFAIILILVSCFLIVNTWLYYSRTSRSEIDEAADKVEKFILSGGEISRENLNELINNRYVDIRVISRDLSVNESTITKPDDFPKLDFNDVFKNKINPDQTKHFDMEHISGMEYMMMHRRVEYNNKEYYIAVFRLFNHEQGIIKLFLIIFLISNIFMIFIAYTIGRYINKVMLKPIRDITEIADNISINDLKQRIAIPETDDEIKKLIITFNDMIGRLDESFEKQNQFVSDASHELKTPIAVIQGYANLIDRWGKSDEEILKESITSIKSETEHMSVLVQQLLFLAKSDNNKLYLNIDKISLNDIALDVLKDINVLDSDINTELLSEENIEVYADKNMIHQLMWIFCENAMKYRRGNSTDITISIGKKDNRPFFSVKDNGIGINEEALPHIFDRFYRADKSRNKTIEGNGLGLSIADWIIKTHKCDVKVISKVNEGSEFIVFFR